jgi:MFS transporter, NNP family, nitrate/nitrite transporter
MTAPAALDVDVPTRAASRRSRWIEAWDPEDEMFWDRTGRRTARRNLVWSVFAEHVGFCIWVLWTIIVINLANAGIRLSLPEQFWLTAIPNLVGSGLRLPYTFAIPRFGGRAWTAVSASLLFVPALAVAVVVPSGWLAHASHDVQFWVLFACAATAGLGGGNFSSSMANISFFFPDRHKGSALGINAAGGNLGVAVTQLVVPLVIVIGVPAAAIKLPHHHVHLAYAGIMWLPVIAVAAFGAWLRMDSLSQAKTDTASYVAAVRNPQTWVMSVLYIGTFGSFIGYSFAMPLVIRNTFPEFLAHHPFIATYLAGLGFLGALLGSLSRPLGGWLADRTGGARITLVAFAGMGLMTLLAIRGVRGHSFGVFFTAYMVIFVLAGVGNGSTYRMIPSIFTCLAQRDGAGDPDLVARAMVERKRQAAAVIGIAGSIGAFGGFLIQVGFRQASLQIAALMKSAKTPAMQTAVARAHADWSTPALWVFLVTYVVLGSITWFCYLRKSVATSLVPSLAHAAV